MDMRLRRSAAILLMLLGWAAAIPSRAEAQGPVGAGPLTGSLTATEPVTGVLRLGRIRLAPGITVREIGYDSNVFDEGENPKEDFVATVIPDASAFMRLRFVQLSVYGGVDLNYFNTYRDQNSAGYSTRGRADLLISRLRPYVGIARNSARLRPNAEIDVRANRTESELSTGVAFELAVHSQVYAGASEYETDYLDSVEDGVPLTSLNRKARDYTAGVRSDLTPYLTATLSGSYREDRFVNPVRNGDSRFGTVSLRIGSEAVISGVASLSYNDYRPIGTSTVRPYQGVTGSGSITYSFIELARFNGTYNRSLEYSFDEADALYLDNTFTLSMTNRLFGNVDVQVRGARSTFDYAFSEVVPEHTDTLETLGASVGYNLRNRTRVSLNYEFSRRRSDLNTIRDYDKTRIYLAWMFSI